MLPPVLLELLNISLQDNLQSQTAHFLSRLRSAQGQVEGRKKGGKDERIKCREEAERSSSIPTACKACCGPILLSVGSHCWFCLIGQFATSLLIDNRQRVMLISPSAE